MLRKQGKQNNIITHFIIDADRVIPYIIHMVETVGGNAIMQIEFNFETAQRNRLCGAATNRLPCCGLYALSSQFDVDIQSVYDSMAQMFDKKKNWKGRTHNSQRRAWISENGHEWERVKGQGNKQVLTAIKSLDPNETYDIETGQHCLTYRNGLLIDQYETKSPEAHGSRKLRVRLIHRVIK